MQILQLHHVSLPTTDLERSRRFYREVLGLEEIERPPFPFPGAWFRLGDRELHLIGGENVDAQGGPARTRTSCISRSGSLSFRQALEHLQGKGYREDVDPTDPMHLLARPQALTGYPQLYITDPDRHLIEINAERLDR